MTRVDLDKVGPEDFLDKGNPEDLEGLVLFTVVAREDEVFAPISIASENRERILNQYNFLDAFLDVDREELQSETKSLITSEGAGMIYDTNVERRRLRIYHNNFPGDWKSIGMVGTCREGRECLRSWSKRYIENFQKQLWWKDIRRRINGGLDQYEKPDVLEEVLAHLTPDSSELDCERARGISEEMFGDESYFYLVENSLLMAQEGHPSRNYLEPHYVGLVRSLMVEDYERAASIRDRIAVLERLDDGRLLE